MDLAILGQQANYGEMQVDGRYCTTTCTHSTSITSEPSSAFMCELRIVPRYSRSQRSNGQSTACLAQ